MFKITVGSDPEYFTKTPNGIVSAIPIFGQYGKNYPLELSDSVKAYHDNVACESTIRPADSANGLISSFAEMYNLVGDYLSNYNASLVAKAAHIFNPEELDNEEAQRFGCHPEFSAYKNDNDEWDVHQPPNASEVGNLRVCGGHIHIGREDYKTASSSDTLLSFESQVEIARLLDYMVGVPLTFLDKDGSNVQRKALYGRPGSIRETPYGIEYRTLSNFWTTRPELIAFVFDLVKETVSYYHNNPEYMASVPYKRVRQCIMSSNKELAFTLFNSSPVVKYRKELEALDYLPYTGTPIW